MEKPFYIAESHEQAAKEAARVYALMDESIMWIKKTQTGGIISTGKINVGKFYYEIKK